MVSSNVCSIPHSHTSGELPSASARSEPGASTPDESRSENMVILFPHLCEPLSRSAGVRLWLSPSRSGMHTFLSCENTLGFFLFLEAERQASPDKESSRLDPVYFTLKKKQRDTGAILYLKEPQTSEEKKNLDRNCHP